MIWREPERGGLRFLANFLGKHGASARPRRRLIGLADSASAEGSSGGFARGALACRADASFDLPAKEA